MRGRTDMCCYDTLANPVSSEVHPTREYNRFMRGRSAVLEALGGEEGCRNLSAAFYARVATDEVLRPFFPGKSLRCATEEFAAFLIQFLGGDEAQTQDRWWLSLRESHV